MDSARAMELIESAQVGVLTTIRPDGTPRPVPVVFAVLVDGSIVSAVDHKPKVTRRLRRLDDIAADPRVSLLVQHYETDWSRLWWVRVDGTAAVAESVPDDISRCLIDRYAQYRHAPPEGPWVLISPERVIGWP